MNFIKKIILKLLNLAGYQIKKAGSTPPPFVNPDGMHGALKRIKKLGVLPDCIVDVGAAKGTWSERAFELWPQSEFILIEPLPEQIDLVPDLLKKNNNVRIFEAIAGEKDDYVDFNVTDDLDGSGVYSKNEGVTRQIKVVSLDNIFPKSEKKTFLLKLDTHGYEVPIFEGAKAVLERTSVIVVEVYGFYVSPTGKLFHEISEYLSEKGFRLFDIVDIMRRSKDNAFWQADAIYLREDDPVFQDNNYH